MVGGSGFIGKVLIKDLLEAGHKVRNYDKRPSGLEFIEEIEGDVRDLPKLQRACKNIDVIYNLAAEHRDDVRPISLYYDVNVNGAKNIVKAAQDNGVKQIIFTSTVALYGLNVGIPDEESPAKPFNDYGKSKYEAEKVFEIWAEADNKRSLNIIRPVVVFGEKNRGNVYNLIKQIAGGQFIKIGSGENKKSMAYVGNISGFLVHLLTQHKRVLIFNYADKPDLTTNELLSIIYQTINKKQGRLRIPYYIGMMMGYALDTVAFAMKTTFPVSSVRIKKFCASTQVSAKKAFESGFNPEYTIQRGLIQMIKHEFPVNT